MTGRKSRHKKQAINIQEEKKKVINA